MDELRDIVETVIAVFFGAVLALTVWNAVFELEIEGMLDTLVDLFMLALMIAVAAAVLLTILD